MANVKVSAIAENTSPDLNDLLYVVTSDGSLTSNRATISNVLKNATNVIQVGTSEAELLTAIATAKNGDAIFLPAGFINIGSDIIINKQIKIIGRGPTATTLNAVSSNTVFFRIGTDNVYIGGLKLVRSNTSASSGISLTAPSTISFSGENIFFEDLWMTWTDGTTGSGSGDGINLKNAGGTIRNCLIQLSAVSPNSTDQSRGIFHQVDSNNTTDTHCNVFDTKVEMTHGAGDGSNQELCRGFMSWNNGSGSNFVTSNYLQNVVLIVRAATNTQTEALEVQGTGVICRVFNSYIDGGNASNTLHYDVRITDSSSLELYNTVMANNKVEDNADQSLSRYGIFNGQGLVIDSASKPGARSTPTRPDTNPGGLNLNGGEGANNLVTTTGSGGLAASVDINLTVGGQADKANTTNVGGQGGYFKAKLGDGAPAIATSGTNIGGPGGYFMFEAGDGGSASGGATLNRGGIGGSIYLITGSGGSGTEANGAPGNIYFATDTRGTRIGRIFVGTSEGSTVAGSGICLSKTDLQFSVATIASTTASGLVDTVVDSNNILRVGGNGGPFVIATTPNVSVSYSGKLLWLMGNSPANSVTFQDEVNQPGSQMNLGGYNIQMNSGQAVALIYNTINNRWEKIGDSFKKNFTLNSRIVSSANITTGEDDLLVYDMASSQLGSVGPVNGFPIQSHSVDYQAWGMTGSNGTGKRIKFYFGSQAILDTGTISDNSGAWTFRSTIMRSTMTLQECISEFYTSSTSMVVFARTTEDLTTVVRFKVTGSSLTSSSNDVIQRGHRIHYYNNAG